MENFQIKDGVLGKYTGDDEVLIIPEGVMEIEDCVFEGCDSLTSVIVPEGCTTIGRSAFSGCDNLTDITIPASVTEIDYDVFGANLCVTIHAPADSYAAQWAEGYARRDDAFWIVRGEVVKHLKNDRLVIVPDGVDAIGERAFDGDRLCDLYIPASVTEIAKDAIPNRFCGSDEDDDEDEDAYKKPDVTIHAPAGSCAAQWAEEHGFKWVAADIWPDDRGFWIEDGVLVKYAGQDKVIVIPDGVREICSWAFEGCGSPDSLTLPASVTEIAPAAFSDPFNKVPDNVFGGNPYLTIHAPAGSYAAQWAEENDFKWVAADIWPDDRGFWIENGVLLKYTGQDADITLPDGVRKICSWAFEDCGSPDSLTLPDSVTGISEDAFKNTPATIHAPAGSYAARWAKERGVKLVLEGLSPDEQGFWIDGNKLWSYTGNAKKLTVPPQVTEIGEYAFYGCKNLTSITLPEGLTTIGWSAFDGCSSLTSITLPEGLTTIGWYAFEGCSSLTSITLPAGLQKIGESAFEGCSSLTSITLPAGLQKIGEYAFYGCSSLDSVTLPKGLKAFGESAFYGTPVTIHAPAGSYAARCVRANGYKLVLEGLTPDRRGFWIDGNKLWSYTGNAKKLTVPPQVTEIGEYAFYGCKNLTSITLPEELTTIGWSAFDGCSSLRSITIPDGTSSIEMQAFCGCKSLRSATIPDSVRLIDDLAFCDCRSLRSIILPEGLRSIGDYSFADCRSLTDITIPASVCEIGDYAFLNARATIHAPAGSYAAQWAEENDFKWVAEG